MKKKILIMIALCASLCIMMAGCGGQQSESEQPAGEPAAEDSSLWKEAYLETLQADETAILNYQPFGNGGEGAVAFSDLNFDGIPELLYFVNEEGAMSPYMKIVTYKDGAASQVHYEKQITDLASPDYRDLPADALYDYQVQGGTDYQVYLREDGTLQMYSLLYGAENSPGMMNQYQMDADGNLTEVCRFGFVDEFNSSRMDPPDDLKVYYWKDGAEIDESEYTSLCEEACGGISELIFRKGRDLKDRFDAPFWDAPASLASAEMTYDQALAVLEQ